MRSVLAPQLRGLAVLATVLVLATSGCKKTPEADPAAAKALARTMLDNTPAPAGVPTCTPAQLGTGVTVSQRTLLLLAGDPLSDTPERAEWINPPELDLTAARVLIDPAATETARRQAAARWLGQRAIVVIRVDLVHVPMALGLKELKRGAVGMRAFVYDGKGTPTCVQPFTVQNDRALSEQMMAKSDKAVIADDVVQALRDDLRVQLLAKVASLRGTPAAK